MKVVIVGCGRVGAAVAETLDSSGNQVIVIDTNTAAFDKLSSTFRGNAIRGDGTDEDVLRRADAEGADLFLTLTEGDNRNVMAAQLALEELGAKRVVAKINDPLRADAYASLGIATLCRTNLMADAVYEFLGLARLHMPGVQPPTGAHGHDHGARRADPHATAGTPVTGVPTQVLTQEG
jgi:trk system potassium uptake protein TrkA